ncbi:MAG: GNAT family N-acetyltransferase [Candidatus Heimdallarchaeota archaeon]|nr:GNAT family N-acetyltransferase [Candidatus Heimdallarchaeota archaeon]MCG3255609.1 GNAT family N-acetyltransferase [Candidatus Heimdallarchaeota archaeon]MCK4610684.1 GNAT family N-acetyltransferase [Candidatus Heimdallarchaeota archaeon]
MVFKGLYLVQRKDIEKATMVLTRAFQEDPLVCLIYPNAEERMKFTPFLWRYLIKDGLKCGKVYSPTNKIEGVAKWLPPGKEHMGIWRSIRSGALSMGRAMSKQKDERKRSTREIKQLTDIILKKHKEIMKEPHWYLASIGIEPKYQGKGYGSALIKPMLEYIEKEGYPVYLETNFQGNVGLYEHLGFEVIDEMKIPETEITNWGMIKEPKLR